MLTTVSGAALIYIKTQGRELASLVRCRELRPKRNMPPYNAAAAAGASADREQPGGSF